MISDEWSKYEKWKSSIIKKKIKTQYLKCKKIYIIHTIFYLFFVDLLKKQNRF